MIHDATSSNQPALYVDSVRLIPPTTTQATTYYYANNELIAKKDNAGTKTYFRNDHLGSMSVVTNQAGSLVETTTYDPYGKVLSGGTASKFQYTGQEKDSEMVYCVREGLSLLRVNCRGLERYSRWCLER